MSFPIVTTIPDKAFDETMKFEGFYANDPQDPGGETYRGIARKFFPKWEGWVEIDKIKAKTPLKHNAKIPEVDHLVRDFYTKEFWVGASLHKFPFHESVLVQMWDIAVNCGVSRAHIFLQRAVKVEADGAIGPKTIAATNSLDPRKVVQSIREVREAYYHAVVKSKPHLRKFLNGWLNRARKYYN